MPLQEVAKRLLTDCMGLAPGEKTLIVVDDQSQAIGHSFYLAARELEAAPVLMLMPPTGVSGREPPELVARAMAQSDVVLCPTTHSLTHTKARIDASAAGARIATMPGITEEMFEKGAITADYAEVEKLTLRITGLLDKAETATIHKDGHTLTLSLKDRKGLPSTGVYKKPGQSGNLPSGEAYIAPVETGSNGTMTIDGSMVGVGKLTSPLTVHLKDGKLTKIEGEQAAGLDVLFAQPENGVLCELGIGTNSAAILCGVILEDEKVYGTVHIAFGTNTSFGGTNKAGCHMDGVITGATLLLDGVPVLVDGEFK